MQANGAIAKLAEGRTIEFDPEKMPAGSSGLDKKYFVVSRSEREAFRDQLHAKALATLREGLKQDLSLWQPLRICLYELMREVLLVLQVDQTYQRLTKNGESVSYPKQHFPILDGLATQSAIRHNPLFIKLLAKGITRPPLWRRLLRPLRTLMPSGPYLRKSIRRINPTDTISISNNSFMERHATRLRKEGRKIYLCSFWEWMWISCEEATLLRSINDEHSNPATEAFYDLVLATCQSQDIRLTSLSQAYLQRVFNLGYQLVDFYYSRLMSQPHQLPKTLWYGSTNSIWARLLRAAVWDAGGKCVGHEHGRGISLYPNHAEHGPVFDLCDEYITYSRFLADEYRQFEQMNQQQLVTPKKLTFDHQPDAVRSEDFAMTRQTSPSSGRSKTVMFVASMYFGESLAGMNLLPTDHFFIDWQARLFAQLKSWGYHIQYKLHPEIWFKPPASFEQEFGIEYVSGTLEDAMTNADILLFEFLSSAFKPSVLSSGAMVFVDFGFGSLSESCDRLLSKRMPMVKASVGADGRADINWTALEQALADSFKRSEDTSCARQLFDLEVP